MIGWVWIMYFVLLCFVLSCFVLFDIVKTLICTPSRVYSSVLYF